MPYFGIKSNTTFPAKVGEADKVKVLFVSSILVISVFSANSPLPETFTTSYPTCIPETEETVISLLLCTVENVKLALPSAVGFWDKVNVVESIIETTVVPGASWPSSAKSPSTFIPGIIPEVDETVMVVELVDKVADNPVTLLFNVVEIFVTSPGSVNTSPNWYPTPLSVKIIVSIFPGFDDIAYWNPDPKLFKEELLTDKISPFS